jgi:hypothetical protein
MYISSSAKKSAGKNSLLIYEYPDSHPLSLRRFGVAVLTQTQRLPPPFAQLVFLDLPLAVNGNASMNFT